MKIIIKKIPYKKQRYPTVGDYWMEDGTMQVRISAKNERKFFLYMMHELTESFLAKFRKIKWDDIDKFDIESGLKNPGASKRALYYKEHKIAMRVEKLLRPYAR